MGIDKKHWQKDDFLGGYKIPYVATLNGEWVAGGSLGFDPKNNEKTLDDYVKKVTLGLNANKKEFDQILVGADAIVYNWNQEFEQLDDEQKWIIRTACREAFDEDLKLSNSVTRCLSVAMTRIKKAGFKEKCSRCLGSGKYSRNANGDTHCYKCLGLKFLLPRLTKRRMAEIKEKFDEIYAKGGWTNYRKTDEYEQNNLE